jgi:hypothetical protein
MICDNDHLPKHHHDAMKVAIVVVMKRRKMNHDSMMDI